MTLRELVIELGVSSVYLEDEIALLEKYNLIRKLPNEKYQTELVIFTDDFSAEFKRTAKKTAVPALGEMILSLKAKIPQIKKINSVCEKLSDDRIVWGLLWLIMISGHGKFAEKCPMLAKKGTIYGDATGVNYGVSTDSFKDYFDEHGFAGYAGLDENYYASAADFGVLPEKNRFFVFGKKNGFIAKIYDTVAGKTEPEFIILTKAEEKAVFELLQSEISMIEAIYEKIFACAREIMQVHAPKLLAEQKTDRVVFQTLFFLTVGFIGRCAVESGTLSVPDFDGPAAVCVRENSKEAEASVHHEQGR